MRDSIRIRYLRAKLDKASRAAAAADQDGSEIEHLNHNVLAAAHALGGALNARASEAK